MRVNFLLAPSAVLLLLAGTAAAHNGEYIPPHMSRPPPQLTPPATPNPGPGTTPALPAPRTGPGSGVATPRYTEPGRTATPTAVRHERTFSWTVAWEILRRGEPRPTAIPSEKSLTSARAGLRAVLGQVEGTTEREIELLARAALSLGQCGDILGSCRAVDADPAVRGSFGILAPGLAAYGIESAAAREQALVVLTPLLSSVEAPEHVRALAAVGIGLCGTGGGSALLAALGTVASPALRTMILFSLGVSGHPGAREILLGEVLPPPKSARGPDDPARRALLLHALSRIRTPEVGDDLVRRLSDPSPRVQAAAALSLSNRLSEAPGARQGVVGLAKIGAPLARAAALLALARAGDDAVVAPARRVLNDPVLEETALGGVAALCLGLVRSAPDAPDLIRVFADPQKPADLRSACAVAVGLIRARGQHEAFEKACSSVEEPVVRAYGLVGLAMVDGASALPRVRRVLDREKDVEVRRLAVIAAGLTGEAATEILTEALGDSYWVNREAAQALVRVAPDRAVAEILTRLREVKNQNARRFAAISLGTALDRRLPSFFEESLLGCGLSFSTVVERLFLHLMNEWLAQQIP